MKLNAPRFVIILLNIRKKASKHTWLIVVFLLLNVTCFAFKISILASFEVFPSEF